MTDVFDFQVQLECGQRGEELFMQYYPRKLELYPGRAYDFTVCSSREKLELKADTYNMNKTDNFFFERYSDVYKKTQGGPWRSLRDKIDILCYYFVRHNIWFEFRNIPALVAELERLTKKQGLIYVKNKGWVTGGHKVQREKIKHLYTVYEFTPE